MQNQQYTPEQEADIKERTEKGVQALKDLQLFPAAVIMKVNIGDDVMGDKVIAYLQDSKYTAQPSPYVAPTDEPAQAS